LSPIEPYWALLSPIEFYWALLSLIEPYWALTVKQKRDTEGPNRGHRTNCKTSSLKCEASQGGRPPWHRQALFLGLKSCPESHMRQFRRLQVSLSIDTCRQMKTFGSGLGPRSLTWSQFLTKMQNADLIAFWMLSAPLLLYIALPCTTLDPSGYKNRHPFQVPNMSAINPYIDGSM